LAGKWRDPLVGRDLLIGVAYGVAVSVVEMSDNILLPLFGKLPPEPGGLEASALLGVRPAISLVLFYVLVFVVWALAIFFFLFLLRLLLKCDWIAAIVLVLIGTGTNPGGEYPIATFAFLAIIWLSILLVLRRFGMLALVVGLVVQNVLTVFPTTSHFSRWYASAGLAGIVLIALAATHGFYYALAGQPVFTGSSLDK
jgi:serine/threonine-protein kinase